MIWDISSGFFFFLVVGAALKPSGSSWRLFIIKYKILQVKEDFDKQFIPFFLSSCFLSSSFLLFLLKIKTF